MDFNPANLEALYLLSPEIIKNLSPSFFNVIGWIIPNALIEHAFLNKECVVNGLSNRIEIWDKAHWEDLLLESEASVEEIAEELEDFDF